MARPSSLLDTRIIYCGDCLDQLRKLPDRCVDLIYIDPPFNSNRNYEVFWGETKEKRAFEDRHASTQAYLEFMRPRCVELARVLKETGSFYYHCDWHASHYVKVMLDQVFGENNFQNEIVWKRSHGHNLANCYGRNHDVILFYAGADHTWNQLFHQYDEAYIAKHYRHVDSSGRRYKHENPTGAGVSKGVTGQPWRGINPTLKGRHWARPPEELDKMDAEGRIHWPDKKGAWPYIKVYLDDMKGIPLQDTWTDIDVINMMAKERLGYPTQKPLALLDRIVRVSSNENDIVLDAFCGCGTAVVAAEKLKRQWIGIDTSPTACRVMAKRLRKDCGVREDEKLWNVGRGFVVRDLPWSEDHLRKLPPFEFENWAVIALGGIPNKAQVGDMGIDGRIYPVSAMEHRRQAAEMRVAEAGAGELGFMDQWYPIQVKQKDKVGRPDIDSFEAVMTRENRQKGYFVAFDFTSDAETEIGRFFRKEHRTIIALTVREILDEQIARKLA